MKCNHPDISSQLAAMRPKFQQLAELELQLEVGRKEINETVESIFCEYARQKEKDYNNPRITTHWSM